MKRNQKEMEKILEKISFTSYNKFIINQICIIKKLLEFLRARFVFSVFFIQKKQR